MRRELTARHEASIRGLLTLLSAKPAQQANVQAMLTSLPLGAVSPKSTPILISFFQPIRQLSLQMINRLQGMGILANMPLPRWPFPLRSPLHLPSSKHFCGFAHLLNGNHEGKRAAVNFNNAQRSAALRSICYRGTSIIRRGAA